MKRVIDFSAAVFGGLLLTPLLVTVAFLVWLQDRRSPFYIAPAVARGGGTFDMVKFRSMVKNADRAGIDSTSANDQRITGIGRFIRRFKIDELPQLWNVAKGDMSLVGPRPNVVREVDLYTAEERHLLDARPGITDLASIVFADEGDILADKADPDIAYNQLIRPGKSRLGLFYVGQPHDADGPAHPAPDGDQLVEPRAGVAGGLDAARSGRGAGRSRAARDSRGRPRRRPAARRRRDRHDPRPLTASASSMLAYSA